MCSTCNYKKYEKVITQKGNRTEEKLQTTIGVKDEFVIQCDLNGGNYSIAIAENPNNYVRMYRCLTCGRMLF